MKDKILRSLLALSLTLFTLPVTSQDYMNVFFKNGDFRKFYLKNVKEIATSKFDANGVQHGDYEYQHVTTIYDKYVYALSDVDSITFTKIDEELAEQNFASAMSVVFPAIADCETITDAENKIEQIKQANGVEATWSDGHELYVAINQGEVYSFHFNHNTDDEIVAIREMSARARNMVVSLKNAVGDKITGLKAVIANQQHFDENRDTFITKYYYPLKDVLEECGIEVHYVANPGVGFFYDNSQNSTTAMNENIYDYDLIFLITHGSYSTLKYLNDESNNFLSYGFKGHSFLTSEELGPVVTTNLTTDDLINYYNRLKQWRNENGYSDATDQHIAVGFCTETRDGVRCHVSHPKVTEFFFQDIAPGTFTNPNSIFFNTACQSLMGEDGLPDYSLANEFTKKGLGVYIGYDETNNKGKLAGCSFFTSLLSGKSLQQAIESLTDEQRHNHLYDGKRQITANLRLFPQNDPDVLQLFLIPTKTMEMTPNTIRDSFAANRTVPVTGWTTATEPEGLVFGFDYDTTDAFTSPQKAKDISYVKQQIFTDNGNVVFHGTLTGLEKGHTYYYRAYTFDGLFYNYGEPRSFTLYSDLQLSNLSLSLEVGTSNTIEILSGNGNYTVTSSNADIATAEVFGTNVTIQAKKVGKTTVTVTDTSTGQTATIEVTVTSSGNPTTDAVAIDLGLPSGTLWADRNVGATQPENYGNYFAWGEVDGYDRNFSDGRSFDWGSYKWCSGLSSQLTKYCTDSGYGKVDNKTVLDMVDDASFVNWGDQWCMPSESDIKELLENTTSEWTTQNGVNGRKFTSKTNGECIFLPAASFLMGNSLSTLYSGGQYWTSSLNSDYPENASCMYFGPGGAYLGTDFRCYGFSVRPITKGSSATYDNLALESTSPVSLKENQNTSINIISGSGSYTATSSNEDIVSANVSEWTSMTTSEKGWCVNIKALSVGTANITVKDTKSGQSVTVDVTVTENVKLLELSTYELNLKVGETEEVVITSSSGTNLLIATTDASIATFTENSNTITVKALAVGTCAITVNDSQTGETARVEVSVTGDTSDCPAEAIDLGLPSGTKWASCNVGASAPEENGGLYAWAETTEIKKYGSYKWGYGESGKLTKYCTNGKYGTVDNKTELDPEDDVANVKWGSQWRIPTLEQTQELVANCNSEWTTLNGVRGRKYTSKINGKSIFLPAAGYYAYETYYSEGSQGFYWTSTLNTKDNEKAYDLYLASGSTGTSANYRYYGNSVRPVTK